MCLTYFLDVKNEANPAKEKLMHQVKKEENKLMFI